MPRIPSIANQLRGLVLIWVISAKTPSIAYSQAHSETAIAASTHLSWPEFTDILCFGDVLADLMDYHTFWKVWT